MSEVEKKWLGGWRNVCGIMAITYHFLMSTIFLGFLFAYFCMSGVNEVYGAFGYQINYLYLGCITSIPMSAYLVRYYGSKWATFIGAGLFAIILPITSVMPDLQTRIIFFYLTGIPFGILQVSMTQAAVMTEIVAQRPLMGYYFSVISVGVIVGLLCGQLLAADDIFAYGSVPAVKVFFITGCCSLGFNLFALLNMYMPLQEKFLLNRLHNCQVRHVRGGESERDCERERKDYFFHALHILNRAPL